MFLHPDALNQRLARIQGLLYVVLLLSFSDYSAVAALQWRSISSAAAAFQLLYCWQHMAALFQQPMLSSSYCRVLYFSCRCLYLSSCIISMLLYSCWSLYSVAVVPAAAEYHPAATAVLQWLWQAAATTLQQLLYSTSRFIPSGQPRYALL